MVKKYKILPAVATLALGVAGLVNANNASAYVIDNKSGIENVEICHTMTNIINPVNVTYTYELTKQNSATGLSLAGVTVVNSTGTISSQDASSLTVAMNFIADGTSSSKTQCVGLNFTGAMTASAEFGEKLIDVDETSSDITSYPADDTTRTISLVYELDTNNGDPIASGNDYQTAFRVKSAPTFSEAASVAQTYITLDKKVRGNGARTEQDFTFTINLNKPSGSAGNTYTVYANGSSKTCTFVNASGYNSSNPCTVTLKHNQTAYIGCTNCGSSSRAGTLYVGSGSSYSITETAATGYTTTYAPIVNGTVGTEVSGNTFTKNALEEGDRVLFYNEKTFSPTGRFLAIFPFVILAIAAGATIIVVRKTSKNKEQA